MQGGPTNFVFGGLGTILLGSRGNLTVGGAVYTSGEEGTRRDLPEAEVSSPGFPTR